jgi:nucleotide-binding universal stress UspA family protein
MFQNIVVGTDGSDGATIALSTAIELAHAGGATLHVVSAMKAPLAGGFVGPEAMSAIPAAPDWQDAARAELDTILGRASLDAKAKSVEVQVHAEIGSAAEALCQVAETVDADLIVVGSRGMKGGRRFLGSVPNSVSHHAPCSVLIVDTGS